jgi:hypothetical protein
MAAAEEPPEESPVPDSEAAVERTLGGIVAPLFDFALHLLRHPVAAELTALAALRDLAQDLRSGPLPHPDPLAVAARHLLETAAGAVTTPRPPAPGPFEAQIATLSDPERHVLLAAFALDLEGPDLAFVLGVDDPRASALLRAALQKMRCDRRAIRKELDEAASGTPLPRELVDRALAS